MMVWVARYVRTFYFILEVQSRTSCKLLSKVSMAVVQLSYMKTSNTIRDSLFTASLLSLFNIYNLLQSVVWVRVIVSDFALYGTSLILCENFIGGQHKKRNLYIRIFYVGNSPYF